MVSLIDKLTLKELEAQSKLFYHWDRFYFYCYLSKKYASESDHQMSANYRMMANFEDLEIQKLSVQ
jgi:hypothetical protein